MESLRGGFSSALRAELQATISGLPFLYAGKAAKAVFGKAGEAMVDPVIKKLIGRWIIGTINDERSMMECEWWNCKLPARKEVDLNPFGDCVSRMKIGQSCLNKEPTIVHVELFEQRTYDSACWTIIGASFHTTPSQRPPQEHPTLPRGVLPWTCVLASVTLCSRIRRLADRV